MATFTAIKNKAQGGGAMGRALDYVEQEEKTLWEERQLVTGWNCVARSAYDEMMTTKRQYRKTDGRTFYQFVQSFDPAEDVTPQEVHTIGLELAQKLFPEYEVVVATHVDTDHIHNHLIVNSVSCVNGRKLHQNAADLQRQRQINDEICMAHGLQVLEQPKKYVRDKKMRPGEYRSAVRGESWKLRLMNTVDQCMGRAKTRADFIREMERRGYQVRWEKTRKAITYTTPTGKKCRDDRLHENKYRKEVMDREFRIREEMLPRRIEREELAVGGTSLGRGVGHLLTILSALYRLTAAQADGSKNRLSAMRSVGTQMEALAKEAAAIRQLLERREQAGKKKGRWRLPQVTLPRPRLVWLWVVPILLGLLVLWYSGAAIWNNLLKPLSQLLR